MVVMYRVKNALNRMIQGIEFWLPDLGSNQGPAD